MSTYPDAKEAVVPSIILKTDSLGQPFVLKFVLKWPSIISRSMFVELDLIKVPDRLKPSHSKRIWINNVLKAIINFAFIRINLATGVKPITIFCGWIDAIYLRICFQIILHWPCTWKFMFDTVQHQLKRMKWNDPRLRFADMGRSSTMLTIHPELLHKDAFHLDLR